MIRGWRVLVAATALGLSACSTPAAPSSSPVNKSSTNGRFDTRADALAATRALYENYLKVSQAVSEDGGDGVERLAPLVTKEDFVAEQKSAKNLAERGLTSNGATKLVAFRVQRVDLNTGALSAYACVDLGDVRVLTEEGKDVTPAARPRRQTSIAKFEYENDRLVLASDESWSGTSIC